MADDTGSPFREALANITGTSWLDEAARSSLRAADSKFFGDDSSGPLADGEPEPPTSDTSPR
jgi:hypothetical protein